MNAITNLQLPITSETLRTISSTPTTPADYDITVTRPLAYPKRPWDVGTLGATYALRHSARSWQAHYNLQAAGWTALGLSGWVLVTHGLFILTIPVALALESFNKGHNRPRSFDAVRADMIACALTAARDALRVFCAASTELSQPGICKKEEARRWLAEWRVALEDVGAIVEHAESAKLRYSYMLNAQLKHTRKVLETCEQYVRVWEDPFALAAQQAPPPERFWLRVDFVPKKKAEMPRPRIEH